jgi:hypothetical protein
VLEASDKFGRSSLHFFQELDVFGAIRVPGGSGILEVGANMLVKKRHAQSALFTKTNQTDLQSALS